MVEDAGARREPHEDPGTAAHEGAYVFPDNSRRRIPGILYLILAAACGLVWLLRSGEGVLVNGGYLFAALLLALVGGYHLLAGWDLQVDERDALVLAARSVGFPVGHASAQLGWRGLRSRPTWRVLVYSAEDQPVMRGFVLVDGVDGEVVEHFTEPNPEDWSEVT